MIFTIVYWTLVVELLLLIIYDCETDTVDFYVSREYAANNPDIWRAIRAAKRFGKTVVCFNEELMKATLAMTEFRRIAKGRTMLKGK